MSEGTTAIGAVDTSTSVDTSVQDTQTVDTSTATDTQDQGIDQQTTDTGAQDQTTQDTGDVDLAGPVKKAIETLKATDPAAARQLRDLYHQSQAFKQAFPGGLKEVQALKATFDEMGGAEGLQAIQSERQEFKQTDEKLAAGDVSVLDKIIQQSPEGFSKLVPGALEKLATVNRDAYNYALAGPAVATLDSWRLSETVDALIENLSAVVDDKGNPLLGREVKALQQLAGHYKGLREIAAKVPEKKLDPEREKLETEKKQFAQQKLDAFRADITSETQKYATSKYDTLLAQEAKSGTGLPAKDTRSYTNLLREIDSEIAREIAKRPGVIQKLNSLDATQNKGDLVKFFNAQFDQIAPSVVQRVAKEWMGANKTVKKATSTEAGNNSNASGPSHLAQAPEQSQIDWSKTKREDVMNRRAYLKGRATQVTW